VITRAQQYHNSVPFSLQHVRLVVGWFKYNSIIFGTDPLMFQLLSMPSGLSDSIFCYIFFTILPLGCKSTLQHVSYELHLGFVHAIVVSYTAFVLLQC
jgi:hypothetical protein